jgi:hypothetical protein
MPILENLKKPKKWVIFQVLLNLKIWAKKPAFANFSIFNFLKGATIGSALTQP